MANGNFAGGDGTVNNPYLIEDAHDLNAVRNELDKHYKLIKDIDLNVPPYNEGEGWIPIKDFNGVFNGEGNKIENLFIDIPSSYIGEFCGGLFDKVLHASIVKNLMIKNANISINTTNSQVGVLARACYGKILNCSVTGGTLFTVSNSNIGGFAGGLIHKEGTSSPALLQNCHSNIVINTTNTGNTSLGGLIGVSNGGSIKNSYCTGLNPNGTGGLVGRLFDNSGILSSVTDSFWDKESTGQLTSPGGTGLTTQQMQTAQTFIDAGWDKEVLEDGTPVWILKDGQYPKLWFEKEPNKFLLKQNNQYYTIKPEYYQNGQFQPLTLEGGEQPNENDYENFGFDDVNDLLTPIQVGEENFRPYDKLDNEFEICMAMDKE